MAKTYPVKVGPVKDTGLVSTPLPEEEEEVNPLDYGLVPGSYTTNQYGMKVISKSDQEGTSKIPESTTGPVSPYKDGGTGPLGETGAPSVTLADRLVQAGYDPARAQELANMLLQNAGSTPNLVSAPVGSISPGSITAGQADAPDEIDPLTFEGLMDFGTGIGIGNTDPTTREVQPEELVEEQLANLLSGDSRYIRNARLRGLELSNARGRFLSSFSAGDAERAAIEAGLPIATADAQAYRDAATQNLNALNNHALANLQRATAIDTSLIGANTNIAIANLDAATRVSLANLDALTRTNMANLDAQTQTSIANLSAQTQKALADLQAKVQLTMQSREMTHAVGMEQLQQQGRVELTMLDGEIREKLAHLAIDGQIDLSKLDHEQRQELEEILQGYRLETNEQLNGFNRTAMHAQMAQQAQMNYISYISSFANTDMDAAAAERLKQDAWRNLQAEYKLINGLFPDQEPIIPKRGE